MHPTLVHNKKQQPTLHVAFSKRHEVAGVNLAINNTAQRTSGYTLVNV